MMVWIVFIILFFGQVMLAWLARENLSRAGAWLLIVAAIYFMHWVALDELAFLRMIWICTVLLAGMKMLVYREWCAAGKAKLRFFPWIIFSCAWFGMNPGAFTTRVELDLEWKGHALIGVACLLAGIVCMVTAFLLDVRNVVILFVSTSLAFHFGVLRLSTAFWRWYGFPVKVQFRNPLVMRGFRDFWGKRWNLAYSQMMMRVVKRPLIPVLGEKGSVFAVFLISGLFHELAITVPVGAGYGLPTLFFVVHGLICLLEKKDSLRMGVLCGLVLIAGIPFLFGEKFVKEVILPSRNVVEYFKIEK